MNTAAVSRSTGGREHSVTQFVSHEATNRVTLDVVLCTADLATALVQKISVKTFLMTMEAVRPNWAKFCYFGKISTVLGQLFEPTLDIWMDDAM